MLVTVLLITIIISIYLYLDTRKPKNFPPGPAWLPILGCALEVKKRCQKMGTVCLATAQMSKDYSKSEILGLKIGNERIVIVNSTKGYKEFGANRKLDGRPTGPFYTFKTYGLRSGIMFSDGKIWNEHNIFLVKYLRDFVFAKSVEEKNISKNISSLIDYLKTLIKNSSNEVALLKLNEVCNLSIIDHMYTLLSGIENKNLVDIKTDLIQVELTELLNSLTIIGCLYHFFPILRYIAPVASGYEACMRAANFGNKYCQKVIKYLTEKNNLDVTCGFFDAYLKELHQRCQNTGSFSEQELVATGIDLLVAGSDTTSKALSFGLLHFLRQPEVVRKAQEEMDRVVGRDRLPTLGDRPSLPYMEACVHESVRIFTGFMISVPHRALEDTTLLGYFIPKDTTVVINVHNIHMSEEHWEDPWNFKPERFLDVNGKFIIPKNFIPFGLGRRRCMGENYGKKIMFLFMSNILHTFNIRNPKGEPLPDPFPLEGVLPRTQPCNTEISLRTS